MTNHKKIDPDNMYYGMATPPLDGNSLNGAYVFLTSDGAREACDMANKVFGLIAGVNAWEVVPFSNYNHRELVVAYATITNHDFWLHVGYMSKDSNYRKTGALCDPNPETRLKYTGILLSELKRGEFFLYHGELFYKGESSHGNRAYIYQVADVNLKHCDHDTGWVSNSIEVHRVAFTLIVE